MISIRMLKNSGESVHKPLEYIFGASINNERFLSKRKKANVATIHLKIIERYHYPQYAPK